MAHTQKATVRHWIPQKIYMSGFVCPFGERRPHQPRPAAPAAAKREANFKEMQQEKDWKHRFKNLQ